MKRIYSVNLDDEIYKETQERLGKREVSRYINELLRQEMLSYSSEKIEKELTEAKEKVTDLENKLAASRLREAKKRKYENAILKIKEDYENYKIKSYKPVAWNVYRDNRLKEMGVERYVL